MKQRIADYIADFLVKNGIDEAQYIMLGGQEQYILMRGENVNNPVIIYLHGGPSSPDGYVTYGFSDYLVDDYTVISWDQRGCGRTYIHNRNVDVNNDTASFEQALVDLDQLVDYARTRFHQDKVIILGHSYGTILGSVYSHKYPEKVDTYIGAAQVIQAPNSDFRVIDGPGHNLQYSTPMEFADVVKYVFEQ